MAGGGGEGGRLFLEDSPGCEEKKRGKKGTERWGGQGAFKYWELDSRALRLPLDHDHDGRRGLHPSPVHARKARCVPLELGWQEGGREGHRVGAAAAACLAMNGKEYRM